jgi:hypothetical protein
MSETNGNGKALAIPAGGKPLGIVPKTFDEVQRIAQMVVAAGMFKATDKNQAVAQATMALMQGLEIGISPMQAANGIAVINGRPCIWGSLVPALIWKAGHKIEEWIEEEDTDKMVAFCKITRSDNDIVITRSFSVKDAKAAGLLDKPGPWKQYRKRMLAMRARGFAANDGVPDVLRGMYTVEEMQDVREEHRGELTAEMPPPPPPADTLADDAAFLAEATEPNQIDIEDAIALREREDAEFIGQAVARFQTAALNATDPEEVEELFVKFEEETDGRLSAEARQHVEVVREAALERLSP